MHNKENIVIEKSFLKITLSYILLTLILVLLVWIAFTEQIGLFPLTRNTLILYGMIILLIIFVPYGIVNAYSHRIYLIIKDQTIEIYNKKDPTIIDWNEIETISKVAIQDQSRDVFKTVFGIKLKEDSGDRNYVGHGILMDRFKQLTPEFFKYKYTIDPSLARISMRDLTTIIEKACEIRGISFKNSMDEKRTK